MYEQHDDNFSEPPPRGETGFSNQQTGFHLIGVYRVPRAGLEAWLGVHITFVSGLFVIVVASTGVLATFQTTTNLLHQR